MTDYITAYRRADHPYHGEAVRLAGDFDTGATVCYEGVVRWRSNSRVPPKDVLELWHHLGKTFDLRNSLEAAGRETAEALAAYRASHTGPSDEERAEARAAHGSGVRLVNVITGDEWET